jgi:hypothetical protein
MSGPAVVWLQQQHLPRSRVPRDIVEEWARGTESHLLLPVSENQYGIAGPRVETYVGLEEWGKAPSAGGKQIGSITSFLQHSSVEDLANDTSLFTLCSTLLLSQSKRGSAARYAAVRVHDKDNIMPFVEVRQDQPIAKEGHVVLRTYLGRVSDGGKKGRGSGVTGGLEEVGKVAIVGRVLRPARKDEDDRSSRSHVRVQRVDVGWWMKKFADRGREGE